MAFRTTFLSTDKLIVTVPDNPCVHNPYMERNLLEYMLTVKPFRQAAIAQGAALRGLQGLRSVAKRCRRHYGFSWGIRFREGYDQECNSFIDRFTGEKMVSGIMKWMIAKVYNFPMLHLDVWMGGRLMMFVSST